MTVLGADDAQLEDLARRLSAASSALRRTDGAISTEIRTVTWLGPDADAFRGRWRTTYSVRLQSIADLLQATGEQVADQAAQQRRASDGGGHVGPLIDPPGPWSDDGEPERDDKEGNGSGRVGDSRHGIPRRGEDDLPPDRVVRTELISVEVAAGIGPAEAQGEYRYLVEYLADGTVRVTEVVGLHGGVGVDAGARVEVDPGETEFGGGFMVGAAALVGLRYGRTWEVPAEEADELIGAIALDGLDPTGEYRERLADGGELLDSVTPDDVFGIDIPIDEANDNWQTYLEYRAPPPVRTGVDVVASGQAYELIGIEPGLLVDAEARAEIMVGAFVESDGDIGLRYEHMGSLGVELDTQVLDPLIDNIGLIRPPGDIEAEVLGRQSIEVLFGADGAPEQIVVEQQTVDDYGPQTLQVATIDVEPQFAADVRRLIEILANPTPENLEALHEMDMSEWGDIDRSEAQLSVSGEDYGTGGGASVGVGGSFDINVERETVVYDWE